MYTKEFEIRWSDIDANRHLANSAYQNFMSHARMAFLIEYGFGQKEMEHYEVGPVVFYEHIYYYREVTQGKPITVTVTITGMSADGSLFEFTHDFYNHKGKHLAHCEMMGAWIDLSVRKIIPLPDPLKTIITKFPKAKDCKVLTKEDTRTHGRVPQDLPVSN